MRTAAAIRLDPIVINIDLAEEIRGIAGGGKCLERLFNIDPPDEAVVFKGASLVDDFTNAVPYSLPLIWPDCGGTHGQWWRGPYSGEGGLEICPYRPCWGTSAATLMRPTTGVGAGQQPALC